jgi:hypothetical protein
MGGPGKSAIASALVVLASSGWMSGVHAADAGAAPRLGERRTLATFPAAGGAYELGLEACKRGEKEHSPRLFRCPFSVRWSAGGKVVSQEELPFLACGAPEPMEVDRVLGADPAAKAWRSSDDCEVQVAARAVEMAPGITALLVTQRTGSEAYYRNHQLFLATDGRVAEAWSHPEEQGRDWSTTAVLTTGRPQRNDVALIDVTGTAGDGARSITASRLSFDSASATIVTTPLPDARAPLFVLQAGRFRSLTEAYQARGHCLEELEALSGQLFPGLGLPKFFLGMVVATREQARAALDQLSGCKGAPKGLLQEFRLTTRKTR